MVLTSLRAVEFLLLSFLPSLISSAVFSGASDTVTNIVSLILFLIIAVGIIVLGYRFMAAIGSKSAYLKTTRTAYAVFAAVALVIFVAMGEEGCVFLMNGLLVFDMFGIDAGISVILSLILLFGCVMVPGYVFKKKSDFYTVIFKKTKGNGVNNYGIYYT